MAGNYQKYGKERYHSDKDYRDKVLAQAREWRASNKKYRRDYDLQRNFGVSLDFVNNVLKDQDCKCAICGKELGAEYGGKQMALDHCHANGHIRGVLCNLCNMGLGKFKDDIQVLEKAIEYLRRTQRG